MLCVLGCLLRGRGELFPAEKSSPLPLKLPLSLQKPLIGSIKDRRTSKNPRRTAVPRRSPQPGHIQFETRRISNHTACRFAGKHGFPARFGPDHAVPPRVLPFQRQKHSGTRPGTKQSENTLFILPMPGGRAPERKPRRLRNAACPRIKPAGEGLQERPSSLRYGKAFL